MTSTITMGINLEGIQPVEVKVVEVVEGVLVGMTTSMVTTVMTMAIMIWHPPLIK
jgi:hypothetical protein